MAYTFEKIISESKSLIVGTPNIFQLQPREDVIGSLRIMTVGQRNVTKLNRSVLLVGETGAGKSTLINALVNYTMGVTWRDNIWFQIVEDGKETGKPGEEKKRHQAESQTSDVVVYQIFGFEDETLPYSLTIIDTPGYGDTKGIDHDDIVSQKLYEYFDSGIGVSEIDAVGLVMKVSDNRLNDRLRYVFDSALSLFGKNMEKNIVALITFSPGRKPGNALTALDAAKFKCARNEQNQPVYFLFDNCQQEDREEDPEGLKNMFDKTTKGIKNFADFLGNATPQKMKASVDVLSEREMLKASIQNLKERVEWIELQQKAFQNDQRNLKKYEESMRLNQNLTEVKYEPYKDRVSTEYYVNSCKKCQENCHENCGAVRVSCCKSIRDGRCNSCSGKCPTSDHVLEKNRYESKTKSVMITKDDMKMKFEENKARKEEMDKLQLNLKNKIDQLQREKNQWLDDSFKHVENLRDIALNSDSMSTMIHLDFLIEKMKEKGDTEKVDVLEKMNSAVDEGARAGMMYILKTAGNTVRKAIGK